MFYSPLEQFTIIRYLEISNLSVNLIIITLLILLIISNNTYLFDKHLGWWFRTMSHIKDHIFIIITIWFIILLSNLIGLIPYSLTITSQIIFVLSIAFVTFVSINILGISIHKWNIMFLFLPTGVPLPLIPLISTLEFSLYFIRILSLTIRLSANMLAGHILLKILIYSFINIPYLVFIILPIIFLEIIVAFLQAYVFLTLVISYYKDVSLPH